jgi:hypothetical protein
MTSVRMTLAVVLATTLITAAGCASAPRDGSRPDPRLLTTGELLTSGYTDAFNAVQSLRPQWLRVRGATSFANPEVVKVYLDGSLLGGLDHLKSISVRSISSIRYLDGLEATNRWGLDHGMGAIVVTTREPGA